MKLLYAADIHTNKNHLKTLLGIAEQESVGAVVIGGDITPKTIFDSTVFENLVSAQRKYLKKEFVPVLKEFKDNNPSVEVFLDLGNDDFLANRDILEKEDGQLFHLLHMAVHSLTKDIDILGYMGVPITPFGIKDWERPEKKGDHPRLDGTTKGFISKGPRLVSHVINVFKDTSIEDELSELEKKITKPFLFVSHAPPYMTKLDILYNQLHVGSAVIRDFIERWASKGLLKASFHGHIHESPLVSGTTVDSVGGVKCYNPGQTERELKYLIWDL